MIFNTLALDADTEWLMLDSTSVRVHQCAAGAKKPLVRDGIEVWGVRRKQ